MSDPKFAISRSDGRSNAQVIIDYVGDADPGRLFSYEELAEELGKGCEKQYDADTVRQVVSTCYSRLLKEKARALHNVRGLGYRLAQAAEHNRLALDRKRRSDAQMLKGLITLQHVKWDELDPESRKAHEGQLLLVSGLYAQQRALEKRQSNIERTLAELKGKAG